MGEVADLTTEILKQIRDEIRATRTELGARIGRVEERLDSTNERLDSINERLDSVVHEQIRHATAIVELDKNQREQKVVLYAIVDALTKLDERMDASEKNQERMVSELHRLNDGIDNVLTGALGETLHTTVGRVGALEARVGVLERRAG